MQKCVRAGTRRLGGREEAAHGMQMCTRSVGYSFVCREIDPVGNTRGVTLCNYELLRSLGDP